PPYCYDVHPLFFTDPTAALEIDPLSLHDALPILAKCTGTLPVFIDTHGVERPWPRRGRARIQEQVRFLQVAAGLGAQAAVVECMAVDPVLQWVCEHRLIRSHIGVITNVRTDHLEDMGRSLDEIARSLANTIPRDGWLVTAD